jgi:signal peptidase II
MKTDVLKKLIAFLAIVVLCLAGDLIVKEIAATTLSGKPEVVVIPGFWSFHFTTNDDIGFSLLRFIDSILDKTVKRVIIVSLQLIGVGIATFFYFYPKEFLKPWMKRLPFALIAAGGLGNAIDRIIRGYVVDYVLWYYKDFKWPVFNLADTYSVIGVILIAIFILFTKKEKKDVQQKE